MLTKRVFPSRAPHGFGLSRQSISIVQAQSRLSRRRPHQAV